MEIINRFENSLKRNDMAEKTIRAYKNDLFKFYEYIKETLGEEVGFEESLQVIEYRELEDFIYYLEGKNYAKSTINRIVMSLKAFYNYYSKYTNINPAQGLKGYKRVEFKAKKTLTKADIVKILNQTQIKGSSDKNFSFYSARDRFLIALLSTTGLRIEEALTIKFKDIEDYGSYKMINIDIHNNTTKLNKRVPICDAVVIYYNDYLLEYDKKFDIVNDAYLFVSARSGKKIDSKSSNIRIRKYCEASGIEGVSNHCFRHYANIALMSVGTPDSLRNKILGGSCRGDMGMSIYFHNDEYIDRLMVDYCNKVLE